MATTRQHFVWGWGRLPRALSEPKRPPSPTYDSLPQPSAPLPSSSSPVTPLPRLLEALETSTSLRSISAAQQHVMAVTNNGETYSWGSWGPTVEEEEAAADDADGSAAVRQKQRASDDSLRFRRVFGLREKAVYHVSVLSDAMYAITDMNDVYGWRCSATRSKEAANAHPLLPPSSLLPHPLPAITTLSCTSIACGSNFTLLLTSSGLLYSLGSSAHGRLALPHLAGQAVTVTEPTLVPLSDLLLTRISAGFTHAAAVTHTGQLLTWGCGLNGRLGNGREGGEDGWTAAEVSSALDVPVIDVSCGYQHTLAVDVNGRVWSFGSNARGQCGWGEDAAPNASASSPALACCNQPVCVEAITEQVVAISAGPFHSAALTAVSDLYTWGWNRHRQCGVGSEEEHIRLPTCVSALSGMDVRLVSCAADYTVAVTDHFMSIEPNYFSHADEPLSATSLLHSSFSGSGAVNGSAEEEDGDLPSGTSSTVVSRASSAASNATADNNHQHAVPVVFEEGTTDQNGAAEMQPTQTTGHRKGSTERVSPEKSAADYKSLLALVRETLLISSLPDIVPDELTAPPDALAVSRSASPILPATPTSMPSTPNTLGRPFSSSVPSVPAASSSFGSYSSSLQAAAASSFHRMTAAYQSKLQRTAKEAAIRQSDADKRRVQHDKAAAEQDRRRAKRERQMEEAADEWTKQLIPRWNEPRVRAKGKELVGRMGVPTRVRGVVWPVLIGNAAMITPELYKIYETRANRYKQNKRKQHQLTLLSPGSSTGTPDGSGEPPAADSALDDLAAFGKAGTISYIDTDLARTFPQLAFFQEECAMHEQLRTILFTFAFYRPDVGYVQGMSYLAAYLLLYMPPYKTFVCFANLLASPFFHCFLKMHEEHTQLRYRFFLDLLHSHNPALSFHLSSIGVTADLYLLEWCMTLYCKRLKLDVVGRVWDMYVVEGEAAVYRVAVGLLTAIDGAEGKLQAGEMGDVLRRLGRDGMEVEEERLMSEVAKVVVGDKMMARLNSIIGLQENENEPA